MSAIIHLVTDSTLRDAVSQLHWHGGWNASDTYGVLIIISLVSAWITGVRMRRKIRKDLGRKATDLDLASIDTWMKVDEIEEQKKRNGL